MLLMMESLFLAFTTLVALYYHYTLGETDWKIFALTTALTFLSGAGLTAYGHTRFGRTRQTLSRGGSFIIVALTWIIFSIFGMIPFMCYEGLRMDFASALFETMSGFTTMGASVISDIDAQPHGILMWRSVMQWMGGLGIVVFSFALIPASDMKNANMAQAEMTGLSLDRLRPKIGATARRLLIIYLIFTVACATLYYLGPMNLFDALCHSFTTISTGGFSTHKASIGFYHSAYIEYVASIFMMLSGINFSLYYYISIMRGRLARENEELRAYLMMFAGLVATFGLIFLYHPMTGSYAAEPQSLEEIFRTSLFHVATIFTSTGYQAELFDYVGWGHAFWVPTAVMMIIGGCAGSTSGGMKMVRVLIYLKQLGREFHLYLHPRAVLSIHMNGRVVPDSTVQRTMSYLVVYALVIIFGGSLFMVFFGYDFDSSISACITSFSNIGPGMGEFGPASSFAGVPALGKLYLCFYMLVGRLEIFTVLFLFMPKAWKI